MRNIIQIIIFLMAPFLSNAQTNEQDQKNILGRWKMVKMEIKDGFYFDVLDTDSSFKRFTQVIVQSRPVFLNESEKSQLTKEDSLSIKSDFNRAFDQFKQLFVEFKDDNRYLTNQNGSEDVNKIIEGTFSLDNKKHILRVIVTGQEAREMSYELVNQVLMLRPLENENQSSAITFKKIE